jgi:hypothetical protein
MNDTEFYDVIVKMQEDLGRKVSIVELSFMYNAYVGFKLHDAFTEPVFCA